MPDLENVCFQGNLIREHQEKEHSIEFIVTHDDVLIDAFMESRTEETA